MKTAYVVAAVALGLLWLRGHKRARAEQSLNEGIDFTNATDWQGTLWQRLSGADLTLSHAPNLGGTAVADPGKVGLANAGIVPAWNGGLA